MKLTNRANECLHYVFSKLGHGVASWGQFSIFVRCLTMPRKILKLRSLNFDPDASVGIRPSFEPKLLFSLLAFKLPAVQSGEA